MKWSRKPKGQGELHPDIATVLVSLNNKLRGWADYLQRKASGISPAKLKWALAIFCVLCISESIYLIIRSLEQKKSDSLMVTPVRVLPLREEKVKRPTITKSELQRIQRFKIYMDSLSNTYSGKALRDSFLHNRAYLLDSLLYR